MKRIGVTVAALALSFTIAGPVAAADFPEQGKPQSCAVLLSLPKDVIGHLFTVAPATAERLLAQITEVCG